MARASKSKTKSRNRLNLTALEPRMMFDGAFAITADAHLTSDDATTDSTSDVPLLPLAVTERPLVTLFDDLALAAPAQADRNELVVIDGSLPDLEVLIADVYAADPNRTVLVLDASGHEAGQLTDHLAQNTGAFDAIHILSHGGTGWFSLGEQTLDLSMPEQDLALWDSVRTSLTESGDLLIYGCNVASDDASQSEITQLAQLTGADIAASTDVTGISGDWNLEYQSGSIEASEIASSSWEGDLWTADTSSTITTWHLAFFSDNTSAKYMPAIGSGADFSASNLSAGSGLTLGTALFNNGASVIKFSGVDATTYAQAVSNNEYIKSTIVLKPGVTNGIAFSTMIFRAFSTPSTARLAMALYDTASGVLTRISPNDLNLVSGANGSANIKVALDKVGIAPGKSYELRFYVWGASTIHIDNPLFYTVDNQAPRATNDTFTAISGTPKTGNLITANNGGGVDSDPEASGLVPQVLTISKINGSAYAVGSNIALSKGTLRIDANTGAFTFTPNAGVTGTQTFTYTIVDGFGGTSTATATINIEVPLSINSVSVNEGSEYVVSEVSSLAGQNVKLNMYNWFSSETIGYALLDTDTQNAGAYRMQYFNGVDWVDYVPETYVTVPSNTGGKLLVRSKIVENAIYEGPEKYTIRATYQNGVYSEGLVTIYDDGTGSIYPDNNTGAPDPNGVKTDDRPQFSVDDVTVNEAAGTMTFTVTKTGATVFASSVNYAISNGTAVSADYAPGSSTLSGTLSFAAGETTKTVSISIVDDSEIEVSETLNITLSGATAATISDAQGVGTILDNDFLPHTVNHVTVNETSPYAIFKITGEEGQALQLSLASGTAKVGNVTGASPDSGVDVAETLEYFNGSDWGAYTPGDFVTVQAGTGAAGSRGELLVRVAIQQDSHTEISESYKLNVTNAYETTVTGIGTILDTQGDGDYFTPENTSGDPYAAPRLSVTGERVPELNGYLTYTVTGQAGDLVTLDLATTGAGDGHAIIEAQACYVGTTTLNVLANDDASSGKTLDVGSVRLFSAATGGTGVTSLTIADQGTWNVNADGTVTFTPVDRLSLGRTITSVYYSVRDSDGTESARSQISIADGAASAAQAVAGAATGRYVRVSLTGTGRYLSLAEVQVMSGGTNVALGETATQSSTLNVTGTAEKAVDGNTSGVWGDGSITHTAAESSPWWQVDLGGNFSIDSINIYNRTDTDSLMDRLNGAVIEILDTNNNVVTSYTLGDAAAVETKVLAVPGTAADGATPQQACQVEPGGDITTHCYLTAKTFDVLGNDLPPPGQTLDTSSVRLFIAATGGTGVTSLTVAGEGTYSVNNDGTITFAPAADNIAESTTLTPIYYSVKDSLGAETSRAQILLGGTPSASATPAFSSTEWILNRGFENVGVPDTVIRSNNAAYYPNWTLGGGGTSSVGVYDPSNTFYTGATGVENNLAFFSGQAGATKYLQSTTSTNVMQAGQTLQLDFTAGKRLSGTYAGGVYVSLYRADGVELATKLITPYDLSNDAGTFKSFALSYTATAADAGKAVYVRFGVGYTGGILGSAITNAGGYADFDNFILRTVQPSAANDAPTKAEACTALEYFDDSEWRPYTAGAEVSLGETGQLQVRTIVVDDGITEGAETLNLVATLADNSVTATGTGTIVDTYAAATPTVNDVTVNEGSPYIVFTVQGTAGAGVDLSLSTTGTGDGHAILGTDTGTQFEYWDTVNAVWVTYTSGTLAPIQSDQKLLVRVAIKPDTEYEASETFNLNVTYNALGVTDGITVGGSATGLGTIVDNGTGDTFQTRDDDPTTPGDESDPGVDNFNDPQYSNVIPKDDDRPLSATGFTVNEASPYGVFTVTGNAAQYVKLEITDATATGGTTNPTDGSVDYATALQYYDPTANSGTGGWVDYTPDSYVQLDSTGELLVRTAIVNDELYEVSESMTLLATNAGGASATATGTILDNGQGDYFSPDNTDGTSDTPPNGWVPDDDRPYNPAFVNDLHVNEASPFVVFTVTGVPTANITLSLSNGTALADSDYTDSLEYWDPNLDAYGNPMGWVAYNSANPPALDTVGSLLVRVPVLQDASNEPDESFQLSVKYTGDYIEAQSNGLRPDATKTFTGTAWIVDDANGTVFPDADPTNGAVTPLTPTTDAVVDPSVPGYPSAPLLDDDRVLNVTGFTVNEASPYGVFAVTGAVGQYVLLDLGAAGDTATTDDFTDALEYWNGTDWVSYTPGTYVAIPAGDGSLLVRVEITDDTTPDNGETLTLTATNTGGGTADGVGTIMDDATGTIYPDADPIAPRNPGDPLAPQELTPVNPTDNPVVDPNAPNYADHPLLDDERTLSASGFTVNETSPYGVFTVSGKEGQYVMLDLNAGSATADVDYGDALEYWNGTAWVGYTTGTYVAIPSDGDSSAGEAANLLVRVAINNDAIADNGETLTLTATNTGGGSAVATGTIVDDATGAIYPNADPLAPSNPSDPLAPQQITPANPTNRPVVDPSNDPDYADHPLADDDRALSVAGFTVNEASPYGVFTVSGIEGQYVSLSVSDDTATSWSDYAPTLEYWNGSSWATYTAGTYVAIPSDGDSTPGEAANLLVRVAIINDTIADDGETLTLTATNTGGGSAVATGTIMDQGAGSYFPDAPPVTPSNPSSPVIPQEATPAAPANNPVVDPNASNYADHPLLDDERTLSVSGFTVNEGSPYGVFTVTGNAGQYVQLSIADGTAAGSALGANTATDGTVDYSTTLEYFDGSGWQTYTAGTYVAIPTGGTTLLVRTAINNDALYEMSESMTLSAANTAGNIATATGTILDNGTGSYFGANDPTPNQNPPTLDDDRPKNPAFVSDVIVNEASPYAVFHVTGLPTAQMTLTLAGDTATLGADFNNALEVYVGGAWVTYDGTNAVLDANGDLMVRTTINNQAELEGTEYFKLNTQYTGVWDSTTYPNIVPQTGTVFSGRAGIVDDGTGVIYPDVDPINNAVTPLSSYDSATTSFIPASPTGTIADDDRPLTVNDVTVNEGSPYAVFTVDGEVGQYVLLDLSANGDTATAGSDYTNALEYWDGTDWVSYTPGTYVAIPAGDGSLLVRVEITDDTTPDNGETFSLSATNTGGGSATGTGTIKDDGTGVIYPADDPTTTGVDESDPVNGVIPLTPYDSASDPVIPATPTQPIADDDRPLTVNDVTVNEGSPYAVFTVDGEVGQYVRLDLSANGDTATAGSDYTDALEYWDGDSWETYTPGTYVAIPAGDGSLLVRTAITKDDVLDGGETFTLSATNTGGTGDTGTGTIMDDSTGDYFGPNNANGTPDTPPSDWVPDDDREVVPIFVSGAIVNEASPYTVFKLTGLPSAEMTLALASGTATLGTDFNDALEVYVSGAWVAYDGTNAVFDANGELLARTTLNNQPAYEGAETLTLNAEYTGTWDDATYADMLPQTGRTFSGTSTIVDDATGAVYPDTTPTVVLDDSATTEVNERDYYATPSEPYNPSSTPVIPASPSGTIADDDRLLSVAGFTVNEASPYGVFAVTGATGQYVKLSIADEAAKGGAASAGDGAVDYSLGLEYWDGDSWETYIADTYVAIPAGDTSLFVRTSIFNDSLYEMSESMTLIATNTGGLAAIGHGNIVDNGTGDLFSIDNTTGTADAPGDYPDLPATSADLDDDRPENPAFVSDVLINEGSPYAVFHVTGLPTAAMTLSLAGDTATLGTDFDNALEVFVNGAWVPYDSSNGGNAVLDANGDLMVRTTINNQAELEGTDYFRLNTQYTGVWDNTTYPNTVPQTGTVFSGRAGIVDDGTGVIYPDANPSNNAITPLSPYDPAITPVIPANASGAIADDDRPLHVNNVTVNEASPYLVFTVTGAADQYVKLSTANGTAIGGTTSPTDGSVDFSTDLEYYDGSAWQDYVPGSFVKVPNGGTTLQVRVAVVNDLLFEGAHAFNLVATNTGGGSTPTSEGVGTVKDDGTGDLFSEHNTTGTPDALGGQTDLPSALNDDRPTVSISSVTVNEASPYAVVEVTLSQIAGSGITFTPRLANGSGTAGTDAAGVEYFNGTAWVSAAGGVTIAAGDTSVLLRTAVTSDTLNEVSETVQIVTGPIGGATVLNTAGVSGTVTILDQGSAATTDVKMYSAEATSTTPDLTPVTDAVILDPNDLNNTNGTAILDDDRPLHVNNVTVNEASPYLVFTVTGAVDQYVKLSTTNGTAIGGTTSPTDGSVDFSTDLEYYDGSAWQDYVPGSFVKVPNGGTTLQVRVAVVNDLLFEGAHAFNLVATNTGGGSTPTSEGVGTVKDDGTGDLFSEHNTTGTPDALGSETDLPDTVLDDDRSLHLNNVTANEASPFIIFKVTGAAEQYLQLNTVDGSAVSGTTSPIDGSIDYGADLEYFDGFTWQNYTLGSFIQIPIGATEILVRMALVNDISFEGAHTFNLVATNTGGGSTRFTEGVGTIKDDGTGEVFGRENTSGQPDRPAEIGILSLNDDRRGSGLDMGQKHPYEHRDVPEFIRATFADLHVINAVRAAQGGMQEIMYDASLNKSFAFEGQRYSMGTAELYQAELLIKKFERPFDDAIYVHDAVSEVRNETEQAHRRSVISRTFKGVWNFFAAVKANVSTTALGLSNDEKLSQAQVFAGSEKQYAPTYSNRKMDQLHEASLHTARQDEYISDDTMSSLTPNLEQNGTLGRASFSEQLRSAAQF